MASPPTMPPVQAVRFQALEMMDRRSSSRSAKAGSKTLDHIVSALLNSGRWLTRAANIALEIDSAICQSLYESSPQSGISGETTAAKRLRRLCKVSLSVSDKASSNSRSLSRALGMTAA